MKKIVWMAFVSFLIWGSTSAYAYKTCIGGKEVKYTGSRTFTLCQSTGTMNYYTAVLWCKGNGGELATDSFLTTDGKYMGVKNFPCSSSFWIRSRRTSCSNLLGDPSSDSLTKAKNAYCQ